MSRFGRLTPASVLALLLPLLVVVAGFRRGERRAGRGNARRSPDAGGDAGADPRGQGPRHGRRRGAGDASGRAGRRRHGRAGVGQPFFRSATGRPGRHLRRLSRGLGARNGSGSLPSGPLRGARWRSSLALWVVICVATPRVAASVAGALYPLPSRAELTAQVEQALNEVGDSHRPDDPFFNSLREEYLERYQVGAVEDLPVNWRGVLSQESEALTSGSSKTTGRSWWKASSPERGPGMVGIPLPVSAARDLSMGIAGSGPEGDGSIPGPGRGAPLHDHSASQRTSHPRDPVPERPGTTAAARTLGGIPRV